MSKNPLLLNIKILKRKRQRERKLERKLRVCEFVRYNVNDPEVERATLKNCKRQSHRTDTRSAGLSL